MKLPITLLVFGIAFLLLTTVVLAAAPVIDEFPLSVNTTDAFQVTVSISGLSKGTVYYLKCAFSKEGSTNYFAYTNNGSEFVKVSENYASQKQITTDNNGSWNGALTCKVDPLDSGYQSAGDYNFKVGRYTKGGSGPTWSTAVLITINEAVTPTPTATPTPTLTPTPTPTSISSSAPTFTPSPTSTPTPQIAPMITFSLPSEVQADQEFPLTVSISSAEASSSYYLKALIGETGDTSKMHAGKTNSEDEQSWLAWNGAWSKMPVLQADASGAGERLIKVKTNSDITAGSYFLAVRVRKVGESTNFDSETKTLSVIVPGSEESVSSEDSSSDSSYTAYSLLEARQQELGAKILTTGTIIAPPELLGVRTLFVQQGSAGIKVKLADLDYSDLSLGDRVQIKGELREGFNEKYLKDSGQTVTFLEKATSPAPEKVRTGDVGEDREGSLVVVNGKVVETAGTTFYLDDDSGRIKVYIKSSTEIDKPKMRKGYFAKVIGIVSQYRDSYRVLPRFQEDLLVSTEPIGSDVVWEGDSWLELGQDDSGEAKEVVVEKGQVLGASTAATELPATGRDLQKIVDPLLALVLFLLNLRLFFLRRVKIG